MLRDPYPEGGAKDSRTQLAVWDTSHPDTPIALLRGATMPTCACFALNNNFVVAAGSTTGAVTLWDLRERRESGTNILDAAYTTGGECGGIASHQLVHSSAVLCLCPMTDSCGSTRGNASFQLASVDDRGLVAIWLVSEMQSAGGTSLSQATAAVASASHGNVSHFDETLIGLRSGGTLRLACLRSFSVWSSVPAFINPHYDGPNKTTYDVGPPLGSTLLNANRDSASFDVNIDRIGVGPGIMAFAVIPANPNEFLVHLSAKKYFLELLNKSRDLKHLLRLASATAPL